MYVNYMYIIIRRNFKSWDTSLAYKILSDYCRRHLSFFICTSKIAAICPHSSYIGLFAVCINYGILTYTRV